jgi:hypothetical protein
VEFKVVLNRLKDFCDPSEMKRPVTPWDASHPTSVRTPPPEIKADWLEKLKAAVHQLTAKIGNDRFDRLEREVIALKEHCKKLKESQSIIVPISSLDPEPFELCKEIMVIVQPDHDSFVATYFDANINASGNTQVDAVANLKDMMIALFVSLENEPKLAKGPARQLAILRQLVRKKGS